MLVFWNTCAKDLWSGSSEELHGWVWDTHTFSSPSVAMQWYCQQQCFKNTHFPYILSIWCFQIYYFFLRFISLTYFPVNLFCSQSSRIVRQQQVFLHLDPEWQTHAGPPELCVVLQAIPPIFSLLISPLWPALCPHWVSFGPVLEELSLAQFQSSLLFPQKAVKGTEIVSGRNNVFCITSPHPKWTRQV